MDGNLYVMKNIFRVWSVFVELYDYHKIEIMSLNRPIYGNCTDLFFFIRIVNSTGVLGFIYVCVFGSGGMKPIIQHKFIHTLAQMDMSILHFKLHM